MIQSFSGEYRFLSNFWPSPVEYAGKVWPTAEHAYQAAKFVDPAKREAIRSDPDPRQAKKYGKAKGIRPDWAKIRVPIMKEIVKLKFEQHPDLMEKLKATGTQEIVEGNWWGDTFWGKCNGRGENHLGKIHMEIRDNKE